MVARRQPAVRPPTRITAGTVRAVLRRAYCQPAWALLFEVGDATGARHTRFADAVAMSLWPSRGLELHGFEIKVARHDWRRELAAPTKAETIAAYCDRWWLVSVPGVVADVGEVPPAWGWIECDGVSLKQRKAADATPARALDRAFLAALLRRAHLTDEALVEAAVAARLEALEAKFNERVEEVARQRTYRRDQLAEDVAAFEAASGIKIRDGWAYAGVDSGRAVRALVQSSMFEAYGGLPGVAKKLVDMAEQVRAVLEAAGHEPDVPPPRRRR